MIINPQPGQKILATIGHKGQRPDVNDARVASPARTEIINGRPTLVADVIEVTKNLAGEEYLRPRVQALYFAFARETRNDLLDGKSMEELVNEVSAQQLARFLALPEADQAVAVDDLA